MTLGETIRARREALGMTRDELARKAGFKGASNISNIELGIQDVTRPGLGAIADALEIPEADRAELLRLPVRASADAPTEAA